MGLQWSAARLGALSVAVPAWDLLKEVIIIFIASTTVWPQVKQQGGNTAPPIIRNWIKDLLSRPCPSEQDPVSLTVSLSRQEASISLLSLSLREQIE